MAGGAPARTINKVLSTCVRLVKGTRQGRKG